MTKLQATCSTAFEEERMPHDRYAMRVLHIYIYIYIYILYAVFWVIPRRLNFICQRFGTPAYEDGTECSETSAYKIQTPGNYPEESVQHSERGESLKSRIIFVIVCVSASKLIQSVPAVIWHTSGERSLV